MDLRLRSFHVQILLVHEASKGSFSRVFDFEANDVDEEDNNTRTSPFESRFPINLGITGYVTTTGEVRWPARLFIFLVVTMAISKSISPPQCPLNQTTFSSSPSDREHTERLRRSSIR